MRQYQDEAISTMLKERPLWTVILDWVGCRVIEHSYVETDKTSLGFMAVFHVERCIGCGRKRIGEEVLPPWSKQVSDPD